MNLADLALFMVVVSRILALLYSESPDAILIVTTLFLGLVRLGSLTARLEAALDQLKRLEDALVGFRDDGLIPSNSYIRRSIHIHINECEKSSSDFLLFYLFLQNSSSYHGPSHPTSKAQFQAVLSVFVGRIFVWLQKALGCYFEIW